MTRRSANWSAGILLLPLALTLVAAAPLGFDSPEELIRRANAAYLAGNTLEADQLYAAAEERTSDPGLVAFNRAAVLFQKKDSREAELLAVREAEMLYARVLDDAACPPERAARAWYNRGTCLLKRGDTASVYRSAIACFERCIDSPAADVELKSHARHNLELAKALWNSTREKNSKDRPNSNPPPEDPRNDPKPQPKPVGTEPQPNPKEPGNTNTGATTPKTTQQPNTDPNTTQQPNTNTNPTQGTPASAPKLQNEDAVQVLSQDDTREHLRRTAERLKRERRALFETLYPKLKAGTPDW